MSRTKRLLICLAVLFVGHFAILWPVGSMFGLGTWTTTRGYSRGHSSTSYQFNFSEEYAYVPLVYVAAVLLGCMIFLPREKPRHDL